MNHWQNEFLAEDHRQRILEEVEQIRLEKLALRSPVPRPAVFARIMVNVGTWMVFSGEQRRKHYQASAAHHLSYPPGAP